MALESFEPAVWEARLLRLAHHALDHDTVNEPIHDGREHLSQAYEHCAAITRQHSRTFYLASGLLPNKQRQAARALYAFCRVSDDLVDKEKENRHQRILQWRQESLANHPPIYNLVALAWADTRANFKIPRRYAEQLLDGYATAAGIDGNRNALRSTRSMTGVTTTPRLTAERRRLTWHRTETSSGQILTYGTPVKAATRVATQTGIAGRD